MDLLTLLVLIALSVWLGVRRKRRADPDYTPRPRSRRFTAFLAVSAVLGLQVVIGAPAASAQDNSCAEAPNPERPNSGMVAALDNPLPTHGSIKSRYGTYGYAGMTWHVYDDNCVLSKGLTDPNTTIDNWGGNQLFNVGKNFVAATNGLHYALAYDELTGPLDKAVDSGTKLFYDNVYVKWFGLVALLLAVWLFKHIWTGDLATVSKRGMWALASMWVATSFLLIGPIYKQIEGQFLDRTTQMQAGFLSDQPDKLAIDSLPDLLHDRVVYRNWLRGEFGSEDAPQAKQYGDQLLDAQAWKKTDSTTTVDQKELDRKKAEYKDISTKLGPATGYFKGTDGSRTGSGFLALFQGAIYTLFQLFAKAGILLAQVLLRVFLLATPLIGLIGLLYHDIMRKVARAAAGVLLNVLVLAALAGMHVLLLNAIFGANALSTIARMALAALITIVFMVIGRPMRRMFQMVELSVGAVGSAMPSAGPGLFSRFRGRDAQPPSAQDEFWDQVRGMDPDTLPAGKDVRRPRPEASNPVMVPSERMDNRRGPDGRPQLPSGSPAGYLPAAGADSVLVGGGPNGGQLGPAAHRVSRVVDTAPVSDSAWDERDERVLVPSEHRAGELTRRPQAPPPVRHADTEVVAGRPVHVVYRPSRGLEVGQRPQEQPPRRIDVNRGPRETDTFIR
ncbi:hypothetical protein [Labedaea rhizosphaerae]|uniref:TrbL/VirB6 plasmid conjugal transfer protein n=1 Tax=Labedaea rhizosphaerae TaxID=598644 RepID=A0A4R6SII5_LABRH|nr:hypothetical protein [Labedaea rhizosphaerae]TDQ04086.1 hypothetical protein EV186_10126 [Labedaea rhizosphaerae]